jgi:hypothetical protein
LLVLVAILGIVVGACTLLFIKAQVVEMRRQADLMEAQTRILTESVAVAQKSAEVAEKSMNATISKERARIAIAFPDESESMMVWPDKTAQMGSLRLNLKNTGWTVAYNILATYDAFASEAEIPSRSEELFHLIVPAYVEANSGEQTGPLEIDGRFSGGAAPQVFYVYLRGTITYSDIFQKKPNVTSFLQRRRFKRTRSGEAVSDEFWESVPDSPENEST